MPKDLPDVLQKIKWNKPAKEVETWEEWWDFLLDVHNFKI